MKAVAAPTTTRILEPLWYDEKEALRLRGRGWRGVLGLPDGEMAGFDGAGGLGETGVGIRMSKITGYCTVLYMIYAQTPWSILFNAQG